MRTVCLADESAARRQEIQIHLQTRGFEVRAYADGMSAWPGVLAGGHELCIISHELPDLSARPRGLQRIFAWNLLLWPLLVPALVGLALWGQDRYQEDVIKGGFWRMPDQEKLIF